MRVIVALGGNALLRAGEPMEQDVQLRNVEAACDQIAHIVGLCKGGLLISHGNGPQSGFVLQRQPGWRLDVVDAQTQGMIGYAIEQSLEKKSKV